MLALSLLEHMDMQTTLNHMLSICTDFAKQYNIVFNAQKTMGIKFGAPVTQQDCINLNHNVIQWLD